MHVLVTADTVGGVWTYTRELVSGLSRRGHRVTLVSFGEIPSPSQSAWLDGLANVDFRATAFRLEWMQDSNDDLQTSREYLETVIDEVSPDVLHLNQYAYGALGVSIPKVVVAHSDVVSWWMSVNGALPEDSSWTRSYRDTVRSGLEQADVVVAPSAWMLDNVTKYYCRPERSQVIYNGRSPLLFNPHCSKENRVLTVGRLWDSGKQASLLLSTKPPVPVTIAGMERHPDEAFRARAGLAPDTQGMVQFLGPQTEGQLRHLYSSTAIYAATSRYEPFGLAPLEAALSRCAIVANDIPPFHEIWGDAVLYFQRNDAPSLRDCLARLAGDRELRMTLANLAYNRARQYFSAERMVDEYTDLYSSLVSARVLAA